MTQTTQLEGSMQVSDLSTYTGRDFGTFSDLVGLQAAANPGKTAIIDAGGSITYGDFDKLVDRVAVSLQRDGVKKNGVVAICASNSIAYAAVFIGTLRAGATVSPLAPSSTAEQLALQVADSAASHLFLDGTTHQRFETVLRRDGIKGIVLGDTSGAGGFGSWLASSDAKPAPVEVNPEDPFNIIYSSGTTGTPKGIVQAHSMRWRHCAPLNPGYGPNAVALISTPLYSNTTLVSFIPALAGGGTLVLMPKFEPRAYLELAQQHRATHSMLVPVQYRRLMEFEGFDAYDLSSFVMKYSTSAPFSAELKRDVLLRWPGGLTEYFGMTEGGGACMLEAHLHPDKLHTVGHPMDGHKVIVMGEDGVEVPRGEIGEILSHSATIMNGYHNRPEETAKAIWKSPEGELYMRTGDLGSMDKEGFVTVVGRKKDMILTGGFNVYPADIEAVLAEHPSVAESAVVGVPSKQWGESPIAVVVPRHNGVNAEALREWVNSKVGKTQRLADLRLVGELPRSAIGKILKREIVAGYVDDPQRLVG